MNDKAEIMNTILRADNAETVISYFEKLDHFDEDVRYDVITTGLQVLQDLSPDYFLKFALRYGVFLSGIEAHSVREMLSNWLLATDEMRTHEALDVLIRELDTVENKDQLESAIWMVAAIGYRDEKIVSRLLTMAGICSNSEQPCNIQDAALATLATLGYDDKKKLLARIKERIDEEKQPSYAILSAIWSVRSPASISVLASICRRDGNDFSLISLIISILADIAEFYEDATEEVWSIIKNIDNDVSVGVLNLNNAVSTKVNTEQLLQVYLDQLTPTNAADLEAQNRVSPNWHPYIRIMDMICPKHLDSMRNSMSQKGKMAMDAIHMDATMDTQNESRWATGTTHVKESCWDVVLRLCVPELKEWLLEGLQNETNPYTASKLAELVGLIRLPKGVPILHKYITGDDIDLFLSLRSIEALGMIGTLEAFTALTQSRVVINESGIPLALGDSMAKIIIGIKDADPLLSFMENTKSDSAIWIAATAALEQVAASQTALVEPHISRIWKLSEKAEKENINALGPIISALGFVCLNQQQVRTLSRWAISENEDISLRSLEALARLNKLSDEPALLKTFGFTRSSRGWTLPRSGIGERRALIIALLFNENPNLFAPAVALLFKKGQYSEIIQLFNAIRNADDLPQEIIDAIAERQTKHDISFVHEGGVMELLARISPRQFVELEPANWSEWSATKRAALVRCLGFEEIKESVAESAANKLVLFLTDRVTLIRRTAASTLASLDESRLVNEIQSLLAVENDAWKRECAMSAAVWLSDDTMFHHCYHKARNAQESSIRKAADDAWRERRHQLWVKSYSSSVIEGADNPLEVWHYGQALCSIGDDRTLEALLVARNYHHYTATGRAWLLWLSTKLKSEWEKRVRDLG